MLFIRTTCLLFYFLIPLVLSKGGGVFGGRGFSAARSSLGSYSGNRGGGVSVNAVVLGITTNHAGLGRPEYSSAFGAAVLGGAGGYLAARGAHSHVILSSETPMNYGGHSYYWDRSLYNQRDILPQKCIKSIDPSNPQLGKITFANGTHPTEIVYGCKDYQICCGYSCCEDSDTNELMIVALLLMMPMASVFLCLCIAQIQERCKTDKPISYDFADI